MQILFCCFVKLNRPCTLVHWLQLVRRNRRPKISTSDATFKSFQCQNFCGFSSSSFSWPDLRTLWRQTSFPCGRPEFFFLKKSQRTRQISFFFVGGNSSIESSADTRKFEHYNPPPPPSPKSKKKYVYYTHRAAVGCMQNVIMLILVYKLPSFRFFLFLLNEPEWRVRERRWCRLRDSRTTWPGGRSCGNSPRLRNPQRRILRSAKSVYTHKRGHINLELQMNFLRVCVRAHLPFA